MNYDVIPWCALGLSALPALLFLVNRSVYRRLPLVAVCPGSSSPISVLIPVRNEEANIRSTLRSILANDGTDFEVIVLDDHSTDHTAAVVQQIMADNPRVRLETAPSLPPGWCGKQHACHVLSAKARYPLWLFVDADVRLAPDALRRIGAWMARSPAALASGVPRQELGTLSERLLLPLIHFILLCFLPIPLMRRSRWTAFSAGCGQLFVVRADVYRKTGGHACIRDSLHDGLQLPRIFRRAGYQTDLFDPTDLATCRMYRTNIDTWRGLGKNATEGLAAPARILPMTGLLLGSQVLPFIALSLGPVLSGTGWLVGWFAVLLTYLPRFLSVRAYHQPTSSALLHPFGVLALLGIQWHALVRSWLGQPTQWKDRVYPARSAPRSIIAAGVRVLLVATVALTACLADEPRAHSARRAACPSIELADQYESLHVIQFPATNHIVLITADRIGAEQIDPWITALKGRYPTKLRLIGVADVAAVPSVLRKWIRGRFKEKYKYPILLDWTGALNRALKLCPRQANVFLLAPNGEIIAQETGPATATRQEQIVAAIERALQERIAP